MPPGNKMTLVIATQKGQTYKMMTFMTLTEIRNEIWGPVYEDPKVARFNCINDQDEKVDVELLRDEIQGFMFEPFHMQVQTVPMPMPQPMRIRQ